MFLTKDDLKLSYGVDMQIGEAYVNRMVPQKNLYWKNRTIYIPSAPGYFFMPIFSDILLRCGADKEYLLSEENFKLNEDILHSAALYEHNEISWVQHISQIQSIARPFIKQQELFSGLITYFSQPTLRRQDDGKFGTPFPSLNRADSYIISLACIPTIGFNLEKAIKGWYALITYFLILDDLADIKDDLIKNEENILIEAGVNETGMNLILEMITESYKNLTEINPIMANRIDHKREVMDLKELLRTITS